MLTSQPHLSSIPLYDNGNLQAGRKRAQSELEAIDIDSNDTSSVRRRISRACDQCNQLRTKCDGKNPCVHCVSNNLPCEYARLHKKRGRAPKREQDQNEGFGHNEANGHHLANVPSRPTDSVRKFSSPAYIDADNSLPTGNLSASVALDSDHENAFWTGFEPNVVTGANGHLHETDHTAPTRMSQPHGKEFAVSDSHDLTSSSFDGIYLSPGVQSFGFPLGDDYSVAFMGKAPVIESPDWLALTTSMYLSETITSQSRITDLLRYPVLRPLLPHIENIIPQSLACDLLEQYFASSTSAYLRPANPYILGHIFRKKSILHPTDPRPCSPALLASMLWVAAQISDAAFLTNQLDARGRICQKLLELTITMLKPLLHSNPSTLDPTLSYHISTADARLGALVVPAGHGGSGVDRVQIDNLATYIHLATVVSASERKAASLRWWNAAWSLARELRLGRELPSSPTVDKERDPNEITSEESIRNRQDNRKTSSGHEQREENRFVSEEEREERRRIWWLLYMQDRHLALCYNRPMFFLNQECQELLQPFDDDVWQAGHFDRIDESNRRKGLNIECTSHSIFGYFLPLMVILGEILDLNHARNRPRFGPRAGHPKNWDVHTDEITQQLQTYLQSLREFESSSRWAPENHDEVVTPSGVPTATNTSHKTSELALQTKTVVAYGTHIMHVLHILLTGKWDPIALLDDNDLWISSQSFVTATGHAVSAAAAVGEIIDHDPDLSFMPFFLGIYLLQGSFLLLLFADKLQGDVSPDVVKACETIVRAHEACVATLDTQYQRNFRKVMRSALQQVRGRNPEDLAEQQQWRRDVLALYRWTGDGTGLAL